MQYKKDYFGFVYIWYNRIALEMEKQDYEDRHKRQPKKHPRLYIGYHMGSVDDGYICSSSWMKKSYKNNPRNFIRRILYWQTTNDKKQLIVVEEKWLSLIKQEELGTRFYNLQNKNHVSEKTKIKKSQNWKGRKHSEESKLKMSQVKKGRKLSEGHKQNICNSMKNISSERSEFWKEKYSDGYINPSIGRKMSEEQKKNVGLFHKNMKHSIENKEKIRQKAINQWKLFRESGMTGRMKRINNCERKKE